MSNGILLEAGTNEMELLVFRIGQTRFGINVAKVREMIPREKTISVPNAPSSVEGSFKLRDRVITLINLARFLDIESTITSEDDGLIILVHLHKMDCGLLVDAVEGINRLRWDQIEPPPPYLVEFNAPITGTVTISGTIILMLDFEYIVGDVFGVEAPEVSEAAQAAGQLDRKTIRVLTVDDSAVIRNTVRKVLAGAGFEDITACHDGDEAWRLIEERKGVGKPFDVILSDIEMPKMDGLHLTSKIKEDPALKGIPVILFSSLINEDNARKGNQVGADAQVTKFDSDELIVAIDQCLAKVAAK